MKFNLLIIVSVLLIFICGELNSQSKTEIYQLEKTISIPIGKDTGKISVEYLRLGKWVGLPDAIIVNNNGEFIIGSYLQKETIQKFNNDGIFQSVLAVKGPQDYNVNYPTKLAVDSSNSLYVLDARKYLEPKLDAPSYSIKKYNAESQLSYKILYDQIHTDISEQDRIDDFWVTPGGDIYLDDWYNSKSEKAISGDTKNERMILMINKTGKFLGISPDIFYENYKGELLTLDVKQENKNYNCNVRQYEKTRLTKDNELVTSANQLNLRNEKSFFVREVPSKPDFIGIDKTNNIYFAQKSIYEVKDGNRISVEHNTVIKYSPEANLVTTIELPDVKSYRKMLVDPQGNIYLVYLKYDTAKKYTEGDHIEIQKWTMKN